MTAKPGETATIDPDQAWNVAPNKDYSTLAWYSTGDGSFEKRLKRESPVDSFSGLNWDKIPNGPNEYYGNHQAPMFKYEFDETEYYSNLTPSKSDEQVQAELNEPVERMEEKLQEFLDKGEEVVWTPTMEAMSTNCAMPAARALQYEISPYFQLNALGYRKNWANTRLCEYHPVRRMQTNWINVTSDFFFRFQMMRWNLSSKTRMRWWKMAFTGGILGLVIDHGYARQYKRKFKWH